MSENTMVIMSLSMIAFVTFAVGIHYYNFYMRLKEREREFFEESRRLLRSRGL